MGNERRTAQESCCVDTTAIVRHFDRHAKDQAAAGEGVPHPVTRVLLGELFARSPRGRTVLELGCGRGLLLLEVLEAGAERASGIDLSSAAVALAHETLAAAGVADRVELAVGDAAHQPLLAHDWVVLDRVICCYPDLDALLANAISAAREVVGFAVPASRGWRGSLSRLAFGGERLWLRLQRQAFGVFVHPYEAIDGPLRAAGFRLASKRRHWLWDVAVYERAPATSTATAPSAPTA